MYQTSNFDLFVTCVDKVGPMLKIWGQPDRCSSTFVEQLLKTKTAHFELVPPIDNLNRLEIGLLCCAKYKDGCYYRAQITSLRHIMTKTIEVKFIDYGNLELISIQNIRLMENVPNGLISIKPQAMDFILSGAIHIHQNWDEKSLHFVHTEIAYIELKCTLLGAINNYRFIKVLFHDNDLADYLVQKGIAMPIPLASQELLVNDMKSSLPINQIPEMYQQIQRQPAFQPQIVSQPQIGCQPQMVSQPPQMISQSHIVSQPQILSQPQIVAPQPQILTSQLQSQPVSSMSPKATPELCNFKTLPLEPNSEHNVYVSYVEDGPYLFSVQLQSMEDALTNLMLDMNTITDPLPLSESPLPGCPCMARCMEDNTLCRAVVINLVQDKCKTYYVDFGNHDVLPFSNIFQIPFKYILPKVMSTRFTLAGLKNVNVNNKMKCAFKDYVTNRLLKLKVLKLDGSPVMQYCELFDENNQNIINVLYENANQYKNLQVNKGMKYGVIVSFIEGCKKFFVQLKEHSDALSKLMNVLATNCGNAQPLIRTEEGTPCVAFYSADEQWYRAVVISSDAETATVKYVDYGNVETVPLTSLKTIDPNFVKVLAAQAIECCLCGYQNMSFNTEIENVFESLTLECEFTMRVVTKQNNDATVLVDLFDMSGNNVAALLIEKLASQKSEVLSSGPLPANKVTSYLNNEDNSNVERSIAEPRSPPHEKNSWRNNNEKSSWKEPERKPFRNADEDNKKTWRNNTESSPPKPRNSRASNNNNNRKVYNKKRNRENNRGMTSTNSWNGDSPTSKRSHRPERQFSKENAKSERYGSSNKFEILRNDRRRSPQSSKWNNSGSESEKSWSGKSIGSQSNRSFASKDYKSSKRNNDFPKKSFSKPAADFPQKKQLPPQDLASMEEAFKLPEIAPNAVENVNISWFYNPENFYCQLLTQNTDFRDLMNDIQSAYQGRPAVTDEIPLGASVIAEFKEDNILYRATVMENKYPRVSVQYIDFGNMSWVDCGKIWQVEKKFMELPMQAIKCGLSNLKPTTENWPVADDIDHIFNKESFTATFEGCDEEKYYVHLLDNETNIRQVLIDSGLGIDSSAVQMVDDPVDLNVLISQTIKINLSHIDGLEKFYVHLEINKAATVHQMIQSYMQGCAEEVLQNIAAEALEIGSTSFVKCGDIWKRGVITDYSDPTAVQIDYPDFGGSATYPSEQLFVLPPELCAFWYQAFECTLHNLSETTEKLLSNEEFKANFEGKVALLYVDEIVDGRLVVTLYDSSGKKLELINPDEGAYPTISALCPFPVLSSSFTVLVSHVTSVNCVYIQRNSEVDQLSVFLNNLFEYYEEVKEDFEAKVEDICCAKSEDGNWYRGRVDAINDETVKVFYIDYGNETEVPKKNVKALNMEEHGDYEFALEVNLNMIELSEELTSKISELTADKQFIANVYFGETGWIADLIDSETNLSLNQSLVQLKLASFIDGETPAQIETITEEVEPVATIPATEAADSSSTQVTITHIDSPSEFYVQLVANEDCIFSLQADLQEKVATLPDLETTEIGALCAAKYSVDEQWYRAEVLDSDPEITTVRFVDYGNTDVLTSNEGSIKTLPADLLSMDKYARKCSLNIMPVSGEEWSPEASQIFETAVNADVIYADIVYQDEKNKTFVELYVNDTNVAQQLLDANMALQISREHEANIANNTGFVSHLNAVSEFWIQLESSVPDLEMIVDRLATADNFPDLQDLSPGVLCAANFPDDEMWYRARILSNTVAGIEVLFIDYGNSSTAMKLKVLPEDLVHMSALAQKCSLNKPNTIVSWSEEATEKFREISADGVTIFTIKKLTAGETSTVELFIDGQNILEQILLCISEDQEPQQPRTESNLLKVHITHVGPDHFWVQLSSDLPTIDEMIENLSAADSFDKMDDNITCAALHAETGMWYRAKIRETSDLYTVLLIDYGMLISTSEVRALPTNIESIPALATLCCLELPAGITDWPEFSISKLNNLLENCNYDCSIEFLDDELPRKTRLFIEGKNVSEEIFFEYPQNAVATESSTVSLTFDQVSLMALNMQLPEAEINLDEEIDEIEYCDIPAVQKDVNDDVEAILEPIFSVKESDIPTQERELHDEEEVILEPISSVEPDSVVTEKEDGEHEIKEYDIQKTESSDGEESVLEPISSVVSEPIITEKEESDNQKTKCEPVSAVKTESIATYDEENKDCDTTVIEKKDDKKEPAEHIAELDLTETTVSNDCKNEDLDGNGLATSPQLGTETLDKVIVPTITNGDGLENGLTLKEGTSFVTLQGEEISSKMEYFQQNSVIENSPLTIQKEELPSLIEEAQESIITEDSSLVPQPEELSSQTEDTQESAITNNSSLVIEPEKSSSHKEEIEETLSLVTNSTHLLNSRPNTPLDEKIVPGSICRGDLELPKDEQTPVTEVIQEEISNRSKDTNKPKPIFKREELIYTFDYEMIHRPMTPTSEKIVPGSISRGDLREPEKEATDNVLSETNAEDASPKQP